MSNSTPRALLVVLAVSSTLTFSMERAAIAIGVAPEQATLVQREQAQSLFKKGRKFYQRKQYEEALAEFRASHDIVASPNTRLLIARCLRESGKIVAAYVEFGRTEVEAKEMVDSDPRYRRAARSAEAERKTLASQLGFVRISIINQEPSTSLRVAGESIKRAAWSEPVPVMPGDVEILAETPGYLPASTSVTVEAGEPIEVTIDARANPIPEKPESATHVDVDVAAEPRDDKGTLRPYAYVAGGIGVAGVATFAIAGLMAKSDYDTLEEECGGPCPASRQDDIDAGRRKQTIANVGLAIGVVGLAAGTTLYLMSDDEPGGAEAGLVVSPGWLGVRGRM